MNDTNEMTEAQYTAEQERLMLAHSAEVEAKGAEFYNCGWATGDTFIHSKTSKGRLFSEIQLDGTIKHEWEVRYFEQNQGGQK